jgi:hypothetical protein
MYLNANIPQFPCLVRREFLYNLETHHGEFENAYAFGVRSVQCRALGFHVALDNGAVFWNLPIHALVHRPVAPHIPLDFLELWDCFGPNISVTQFTFLKELRCDVLLKDRTTAQGVYMFTIDWSATDPGEIDVTFSEVPSEHKCAHLIRLDNGLFAAQPNNRVLWRQSSFVVKRDGERPDYKLNTHKWVCEYNPKWVTEDNDRYLYEYRHIDDGAVAPPTEAAEAAGGGAASSGANGTAGKGAGPDGH